MPITRKPKLPDQSSNGSTIDVDALISRGGSVAAQTSGELVAPQKQNATVNLRIPLQLLERIDHSIESRPLKTPRHTWILEALLEKLDREGKED